jgi:hypothetical protein
MGESEDDPFALAAGAASGGQGGRGTGPAKEVASTNGPFHGEDRHYAMDRPTPFRLESGPTTAGMKKHDKSPTLTPALLEAVGLALGGDWQGAHAIAQEHEDDDIANWIHAVAHRMEGDLGNARYWYRRCGRKLREGTSTDAELREIRAALTG